MSNQEMQFADPDWEPTRPGQQSPAYTPQPINDDRRERFQQPVVETPPAQEENYGGYAGAQPEQFRQPPTYQYPQRPYRRRRNRVWLWILIIALFFGLSGGGVGALGSIGQKSVTGSVPVSTLAGAPTIVINDTNGNIHVSHGNSLSIEDVKHSGFFDDPNNINVKSDTSGGVITVNVDTGDGFLSGRSVDFNITVPDNANLQLKTTSGDITVDNANGDIALQTTSGNITTSNDTFVGDAILQTTSGDIQSTNDVFSNNANLSTTSGDVSMNQDTLNGSAKVNATSGDIDFTGTLAPSTTPNVSYQFTAISGDIHVGLPANASFNVQADTTSGSIDAGAFPSINVQDAQHGPGSHASGSVGSGGPSITITTTSGDITLHQR